MAVLKACENECKDNQTCWSTCVPKKGNENANKFWQCIVDNDCMNKVTALVPVNDPVQCMKDKCPKEYAKCDDTCMKILKDCSDKCGSKQSCWQLCLGGKHNQAAIDLAKCAQANGCDKAK